MSSAPDTGDVAIAGEARATAIALAELGLVCLILVVGFPVTTTIPLLVLGSLSLWFRGRSWADVGLTFTRDWWLFASVGLVLGVATQFLDVWVIAPQIEHATGRTVELGLLARLRGNTSLLITALVLTWATVALGGEMVFRGYVFDRVDALFKDRAVGTIAGVVVSAAVFAWAMAGDGEGLGMFVLGAGYGVLYLAARRNLILPIAFHGAFTSTSLVLTYLKVV